MNKGGSDNKVRVNLRVLEALQVMAATNRDLTAELRGALMEAKEAIEGKRQLNTLDNLINELRAYVNTTQEHVSDNRHSY